MPRVRRDPIEAKRLILDAAADLLRAGGPNAVQVRAVAARVGVTDAAVHHHFGGRSQLLEALLRDAGGRIRRRLQSIVDGWAANADAADVAELVDALADGYRDGYGELGLALYEAGWRDRGSGMLAPVVDELHRRAVAAAHRDNRPAPDRLAVELTLAAVHQAMALDTGIGHEFRRSVGLTSAPKRSAELARDWWKTTLQRLIDG